MLGVIGGSGLYDLPELTDRREVEVETPFGAPSDRPLLGRLGGAELAFVARHGRGHRLSPTYVPYRANIYALKALGVTHVLSVSAVGSLREQVAPLDLVVPDQIVDRTVARDRSFFGRGIVAHVGVAHPFCPRLRDAVRRAASAGAPTVHDGGTYLCIEGPQFSTRAESELYRSWGATIIGMTAAPEAKLAREAELCYAALALVTDYDVWHETEAAVTVDMVVAALATNAEAARAVVRGLSGAELPQRDCGCADALSGAIATAPEAVTPEARRALGLIAARYLQPNPAAP